VLVVDGAVMESALNSPADWQRQVQRILQSGGFRNATTLQQLLQFLTARSLARTSAEPLKEYTIGVEAFGRPQDFDPKTDTIVRVQIHRLRQKLREYYESDGQRDQILVEIPKGYYLPRFEVRSDPDTQPDRNLADEAATDRSTSAQRGGNDQVHESDARRFPVRRVTLRNAIGVTVLLAVAVALGVWIGSRLKASNEEGLTASFRNYSAGADPVKAFWANFIGDDPTPIIAYPDAVFLLDNSNDLFRYRQGASDNRGALVDSHLARQYASNPRLVSQAGALYYDSGYTGAGELQGVAMLSTLFGQMGVKPLVKPGRDLTAEDLRQHSVILMGSSFQNVAVAQLVKLGDFSFQNPDARLEQWRAEILNSRPQGQEEASYRTERDPVTHVLKADYGIVSIQPGVVSGRHIAILGGLDTTGTEGATMYATSQAGVEEMRRALKALGGKGTTGEMPPFQALVRVQLEKGYEVLGTSLVTVHAGDLSKSRPAGVGSDPSHEKGE
jgi:hypothetical protein